MRCDNVCWVLVGWLVGWELTAKSPGGGWCGFAAFAVREVAAVVLP